MQFWFLVTFLSSLAPNIYVVKHSSITTGGGDTELQGTWVEILLVALWLSAHYGTLLSLGFLTCIMVLNAITNCYSKSTRQCYGYCTTMISNFLLKDVTGDSRQHMGSHRAHTLLISTTKSRSIRLFNQCLSCLHHVPGAIVGTGHTTSEQNQQKALPSQSLRSCGEVHFNITFPILSQNGWI